MAETITPRFKAGDRIYLRPELNGVHNVYRIEELTPHGYRTGIVQTISYAWDDALKLYEGWPQYAADFGLRLR